MYHVSCKMSHAGLCVCNMLIEVNLRHANSYLAPRLGEKTKEMYYCKSSIKPPPSPQISLLPLISPSPPFRGRK